jgi:biopolymer transport protein TolR
MSFGRLERTSSAQPMSEINMTPLIDVMLVLLVIFIITAPLLVGAVKVELPKAEGATSLDVPQSVSLSIDKAGQLFVDGQALSAEALGNALKLTAQRNPQAEVQLRADTAVPYGRVVEVMGLVHKAGLTRLGFVAQAPEQAAP